MAKPADKMLVTMSKAELEELIESAVRKVAPKPLPRWTKIEEAAEHFGTTTQTIRTWCRDFAPQAMIGEGRVIRVSIERLEATRKRRDELTLNPPPVSLPGIDVPRGASGVYAVQGVDGFVKIGRAIDVESRLRELQTGHPVPLRLVAILSDDINDECLIHRRWSPLRIPGGEWFRLEPELFAFLESSRRNA